MAFTIDLSLKLLTRVLSVNIEDKAFDIGNRKLAIKKAIHNAAPQETILVAGKGHEEKQVYKNRILKISDKKIIKKINFKNKSINKKKQNY